MHPFFIGRIDYKRTQEYEKVAQRCFEAISSLRQSGIPRYVFDEVCQIENLRYRFQSKPEVFDMVSDYAMRMVDEPLDTFPRQTLIPSLYAPEKIEELIATLTPQTCLYTLMAPHHLTKMNPTVKEKWLGVDYTLVPISPEKMDQWAKASSHSEISIPRPNPFLPANLTIKGQFAKEKKLIPEPTLISDEALGKIYSAQDTQFLVPEVCWTFTLKTPQISEADPLSHVFADLYCHTVNEALNATSYEALMGGLTYSLKPKQGALELTIKGYSDKATDFLYTIIETMHTACPTQKQFSLYHEQLARDYTNALNVTPLKQGGEVLLGVLFKEFSGLQDKSTVMKKATYDHMRVFCQNVLHECYVEGMLYGNISNDEAKTVWETMKQTLAFTPYPPSRHPKIELANLPAHDHPSFLVVHCQNPANALILTADCGNFTFKRRAAQEILTKGLEEPFFSELRTRQQTAYLVTNWSQELERHLYSFFAIQSSSHDTRDLLARFSSSLLSRACSI